MFKHTTDEQIKCVKREIAMREGCYAHWVANGRMKQEKADLELGLMKAVLETLERVKLLEDPESHI